MSDRTPHSENYDALRDQKMPKPAIPEADAPTMRECHEGISQVLFSMNLTLCAAQRAVVDDSVRVPHLLELLDQQLNAGFELLRRLNAIREPPIGP